MRASIIARLRQRRDEIARAQEEMREVIEASREFWKNQAPLPKALRDFQRTRKRQEREERRARSTPQRPRRRQRGQRGQLALEELEALMFQQGPPVEGEFVEDDPVEEEFVEDLGVPKEEDLIEDDDSPFVPSTEADVPVEEPRHPEPTRYWSALYVFAERMSYEDSEAYTVEFIAPGFGTDRFHPDGLRIAKHSEAMARATARRPLSDWAYSEDDTSPVPPPHTFDQLVEGGYTPEAAELVITAAITWRATLHSIRLNSTERKNHHEQRL